MGELWERLQTFGFTQYEARSYVTLVEHGKLNAYQVSKTSGIPRARIYETLDGLANRGIVMVEEDNEGNKSYIALPVDVLLDQIGKQWQESFNGVQQELKWLETRQPTPNTYVATVKGQENILAFCRILLRRAKQQVTISMWAPMYNELLPEFEEIVKSGLHLKGIVFNTDSPIGELYPHRMNKYMASIVDERWFVMSVDGKELLYGHSAEQGKSAFYTDDPVHLYLLEDYIWHDVLVNRLVERGSQEQLDNWILPEMERFFGKKMVPNRQKELGGSV